ncbi:hypothetical protein KL942_000991 [Ogataea angusta]|uniref:N-terminal acetyltransferase B complex subunit NAA25 homolog n=1 Tax=Pichia angusta TaxID=870730 RepID=A0ABQ7S1T7_PICAN|nr:hypothetical protein KL942_000991 [Ogataea angusta]KAG7851952.1 hypothetical protein KL940_000834 [Ogataea angusta]
MYKDSAIENAVRAGNLRNALVLVSKKIKEHPNSSYFYALEAEILALSGRRHEAESKANQLLDKLPSDPDALKLLANVYDLCEVERDVFDKVCKKYPSVDLVYEYFTFSVARGDILGMQKASMLLTRAVATSKQSVDTQLFKFWAATCLMLACRCCSLAPSVQKLYPQLGVRLMEQVGLPTAQHVYVYVRLLQLAGREDDSLRFMENFLAKENDLELKIIYLETLDKMDESEELFRVCQNYLTRLNEDDWDTWKLLIKAAKATKKLDRCRELIASYSSRNTGLAAIELGEPDAIQQYFHEYGAKLCCFTDLKPYVKKGVSNEALLKNSYDKIVSLKEPTLDHLIIAVNYMKFKALDARDKQLVTDCCMLYNKTKFHLNRLEEFDYFPGYEFLVLAIEALIEHSSFDLELVYSLIVILEEALVKNKYEFHLKLWLIRLYTIANLQPAADELYRSLKIKFVQHDTLSYLIGTRRSIGAGPLVEVARFYTQNVHREIPHMIISGFQSTAMNKIQGFMEFYNRLNTSFAKISTAVELIRAYRLKDDQKSVDEQVSVLRSLRAREISDNRDFKTFWDCGVHERVAEVDSKLPPYYSIAHLRLLMLRELLIYDPESRKTEERKKELLELYAKVQLYDIEKWSFSVLFQHFDGTEPLPLPPKPDTMLSSEFNYYHAVVVDTYKQIAYLKGNTRHLKSILTTLRNENREYKSMARKQLEDVRKKVKVFLKNNFKELDISDNSISTSFAKMRQDLDSSIAYLQGL